VIEGDSCVKTLRRFWFTFIDLPKFSPLNLGCGVTAYDYADALKILQAKVFDENLMPTIASFAEDVDMQTLDRNHVLPNIGAVTDRGVWFPLGY
jgi:hypothetical protein